LATSSGFAQSLHGIDPLRGFLLLGREAVDRRCEGEPGCDRVAADASRSVLDGDRLGELHDPGLRRSVDSAHPTCNEALDRRGVDDGPFASGEHRWDGVLAADPDTLEIDGDEPIEDSHVERDDLDELVEGHAVVDGASEVAGEVFGPVERDVGGDGDQAAVSLSEAGTLPDVAEENVVVSSTSFGAKSPIICRAGEGWSGMREPP
jgi:hypothetical protein